MPQFDISTFPSQIFYLLLFFACLYLFMQKFALPSIRKRISMRDDSIKDNVSNARILYDKAQDLEDKHSKAIDELNAFTEKKRTEVVFAVKKKYANILQELNLELENKYQENIARIDSQIENFYGDKDKYVFEIASNIITRLSNKPIENSLLKKLTIK